MKRGELEHKGGGGVLWRRYSAPYLSAIGEADTNCLLVRRGEGILRPVPCDFSLSATRFVPGSLPFVFWGYRTETVACDVCGEAVSVRHFGIDASAAAVEWAQTGDDNGGSGQVAAVTETGMYGTADPPPDVFRDCSVPDGLAIYSYPYGLAIVQSWEGDAPAHLCRREHHECTYWSGAAHDFVTEDREDSFYDAFARNSMSLRLGTPLQPYWGAAPDPDDMPSGGSVNNVAFAGGQGVWGIPFSAEVRVRTMSRDDETGDYTLEYEAWARADGWFHSTVAFHRIGPSPRAFSPVQVEVSSGARYLYGWAEGESSPDADPAVVRSQLENTVRAIVNGANPTLSAVKHSTTGNQQ